MRLKSERDERRDRRDPRYRTGAPASRYRYVSFAKQKKGPATRGLFIFSIRRPLRRTRFHRRRFAASAVDLEALAEARVGRNNRRGLRRMGFRTGTHAQARAATVTSTALVRT